MAATKYFKNPFAVAGDQATVPEVAPPDGSLSWESGYGPDYQKDYPDDPESLALQRAQYNRVLNNITTALQQYQQIGVPNFISTSDNGGTPFPYAKNSFALYFGKIYQSITDDNETLPTDTENWRLVDENNNQAVIYYNVVFDESMGVEVEDGDVVYWDAGNEWFALALADGTVKQNVAGIADVTNKRLYVIGLVPLMTGLTSGAIYYLSTTVPGGVTAAAPSSDAVQLGTALSTTSLSLVPQPPVQGLEPAGSIRWFSGLGIPAGGYLKGLGQEVLRSAYPNLVANTTRTINGNIVSGSPIITGLSSTADLEPGYPLSGTGIPAGAIIETVDSGTQVTISENATTTGTEAIFFAPNGVGDGVTTFNVYDGRNRSPVGTGQAPGFDPIYLGEAGGSVQTIQTRNQVAAHNHGYAYVYNDGTGDNIQGGSAWTASSTLTNDNTPAGQPMTTVSPYRGTNCLIKT